MTGLINIPSASLRNLTDLPVLMFYGTKAGSTYAIPSSNVKQSCNPEYFEYDPTTRQFLCKKSFKGNIYVLSTGNMNAAGSDNVICYCRWQLYVNDSQYQNTGTSNSGARYNTYNNVSFAAGGATYIQGYCYSTAANKKSGTGDFLYIVTLAQ